MKHPRIPLLQNRLCGVLLAALLAAPLSTTAQPPVNSARTSSVSKVSATGAKAAAADDAKAAAKDNATAVPGNAGPAVPATQLPRDTATSSIGSGRAGAGITTLDAAAAAAGKPVTATSAISDRNAQKPGSNQGFADKPSSVSSAGQGNPARDQGGSIGGPLGAAAANSGGSTGIAGQGKGAISSDLSGSKQRNGADQIRAVDKEFTSSNGENIKVYEDGGFDITRNGKTESYDSNHQCTTPKTCSSIPGEEQRMTKAEYDQFLKANPALAAQLQQAKSGGSGDTDPGRGDGEAFSHGTAVAPPSASQRQRDLVGNPGQAQTGGTRSGNSGSGFNGDRGAIDLGPDATETGGNLQQNPADVVSNTPTRDLPSRECDRDGRTPQTTDDCAQP